MSTPPTRPFPCWPQSRAATAAGIRIESLRPDPDADPDLRGFPGIGCNATVGVPGTRYLVQETADATPEDLERLHRNAVAHGPNAQTVLNAVALKGETVASRPNARDRPETRNRLWTKPS